MQALISTSRNYYLFTDVPSPATVVKAKKGLVVGGKKSLRDSKGSVNQLDKLYQLLKKIELEILELEEKELDLDELKDANSHHIQETKLKKKAVEVWQAICQVEKRNPDDIGRVNKRKFIYKGSLINVLPRWLSLKKSRRFIRIVQHFS